MMIEENIEVDVVAKIAAMEAQFKTDNKGKWFSVIEASGLYDIDFENISQYVKSTPACLVEFGEDDAEDFDNSGIQSKIDAVIYVYVIVNGAYKRSKTSEDAMVLSRYVKQALRGQTYEGEYLGDYRYRGSTPRARINSTLLIRGIKFSFKTID